MVDKKYIKDKNGKYETDSNGSKLFTTNIAGGTKDVYRETKGWFGGSEKTDARYDPEKKKWLR